MSYDVLVNEAKALSQEEKLDLLVCSSCPPMMKIKNLVDWFSRPSIPKWKFLLIP